MKYFLIIILSIIFLIIVVYKYLNYRLIKYQENGFKKLSSVDFEESPRHFPDSMKLSDTKFWELIEDSKEKYPNSFDLQMKYLTKQLVELPNEKIVGFEMTLREKVIELWDYKVKSLYQIIYGDYFSTDVFIYFRFWIVSQGKDYFQMALKNTDQLSGKIGINEDGDGLLYVADNAFILKNGQNSGLKLPRDQASDVDYDFGNYKMTGEYIELRDFQKKFPKLTKKN